MPDSAHGAANRSPPLPPPAGRTVNSRRMRLIATFGSDALKLYQPFVQVLPSTAARSKRKPSTPCVVDQYASESTIRFCATVL
mgnify:CR=1 FL=1